MKRSTCLLVFLGVLVGGFLLLQLIPYGHDHNNPPVVKEPTWDSPTTRLLAQRACFDCHSNETVWPWYTNIAPVSWLIANHVDEGRQVLNFSDWTASTRRGEAMEVIPEVIQENEMPPAYYDMIHPTARLTPQEKQILIDGLQ